MECVTRRSTGKIVTGGTKWATKSMMKNARTIAIERNTKRQTRWSRIYTIICERNHFTKVKKRLTRGISKSPVQAKTKENSKTAWEEQNKIQIFSSYDSLHISLRVMTYFAESWPEMREFMLGNEKTSVFHKSSSGGGKIFVLEANMLLRLETRARGQ